MATILQIANADRNISLFCTALKTSELETTLSEMGPFTILAPVNIGLRKLNFDQLLEPANRDKLLYLLSGYILKGKKMKSDFRNDQQIPMLNGKTVSVSVTNGDILINGAKILAHDKQGSNGVIHLLDNTYAAVPVA